MPVLRAVGLAIALIVWLNPGLVIAQSKSEKAARQSDARELDRAKRETLWIVADGRNQTAVRAMMDVSNVVDDENGLRVLPVLGEGTAQSIADILYLKGIDIGIVQQDALHRIRKAGRLPKIQERIRYIAKLYNEEMHLVAGEGIESVQDLAGKKVNLGPVASATHATARAVFEALDVTIEAVEMTADIALERVRSGGVAATVYVAGAPARSLTRIGAEEGLKLLSIPFVAPLQEIYIPATLKKSDYPGLIADGEMVETIGVGTVMAVFNWQQGSARYERVNRFIKSFFSRFNRLHDAAHHRKWQEVNLAATVKGWERFKPAAAWLEANKGRTAGKLEEDFQKFLSANRTDGTSGQLTSSQREALFREFVRWRGRRPQQTN